VTRIAVAMTAERRSIAPLALVLRQAEREHLLKALAIAEGKRARAAELLGISRKNLWEKLRSHGLSDSDLDDSAS
jgi:DNA-binding NtrC family response regulator